MNILDNMELKQATEPTEEELLAEARAWGFDTIEDWDDAMDEAYREFEEEEEEWHEETFRRYCNNHNMVFIGREDE